MNVAAVTMGYNEPDFLPIWARHYSAQVGPENCYYIDHGSDDGSTDVPYGINIVRIPRSPYESPRSARFMSNFCSSLLEWYDYVLHTDVDEMVVADPAVADSLTSYCATCDLDAVTAIGFNLLHTGQELPIEQPTSQQTTQRPQTILERRGWLCFSAAMCKPVLTRKPIVWNPGFHRADEIETRLDDLYLLHLRFFDRDIGLRRLAKTRAMPWADLDDGWWQRLPDEECLEMFARYDRLPKNKDVRIRRGSKQVLAALRETFGTPDNSGTFHINFEVEELWPLPKRFRSIF